MTAARPLTVYAYEDENGELFVYRCPECGSSGPVGSTCDGHERPLADYGCFGPERKPVRVPGVGEEPRYTLEQVRAGLLSDGVVAAVASLYRPAGTLAPPPLFMLNIENQVRRDLNRALDHLPVGAGAVAPAYSAAEVPGSADSDGSQQPQGGDVCPVSQRGPDVAEGGSVQCDGVALAQLREQALEMRELAGRAAFLDRYPDRDWSAAEQMSWEGNAMAAVEAVFDVLTQQQSSGGQEGGVEEGAES